MNIPGLVRRYLPILDWGAKYTKYFGALLKKGMAR